jgi:putative transposase
MARPLRIQNEGGWYHVINRGIDRGSIYRDARDRRHFLELLEAASGMHMVEVHGYVLMGNHYHLILRVPEGNLSQAMQWVNVSYSVWFNRRHGRIGPLFQGRFKSVPVENGGWLYQLSQYVHLNPVRVRWLGLDKRGRRLEGLGLKGAESAEEAAERLRVLRSHEWSSYKYYAGYERAPRWLHVGTILERAGGKSVEERARKYRAELEGYVKGGYEEDWAWRLRNGLAVGTGEFISRIKRGVEKVNREWGSKREIRCRRTFPEVVNAVETARGEKWGEFAERHGDFGRDLVLSIARESTGLTLRELGELAGGMDYAAVGEAVRRLRKRLKDDRSVRRVYKHALQILQIET